MNALASMPSGFGDGCTLWPNGDWVQCCDAHDWAYAQGVDKIQADLALAQCVAGTGHGVMALVMLLGVSIFGGIWYAAARRRRKNGKAG